MPNALGITTYGATSVIHRIVLLSRLVWFLPCQCMPAGRGRAVVPSPAGSSFGLAVQGSNAAAVTAAVYLTQDFS